ncbi:MAG: Gfo/Idh/MocA family protein [Roseobacter sp.]
MITVAILGAGIGREHLEAYRALPDFFQVAYIIDRDLDKAAEICGTQDISVRDDLDVAIHDPDVDLIDVCLPPHLHVPVTIQALAAGKHVICEKPIATSMADAQKLKRASDAAERFVFPVFQYRWGPAFAQLRHLVKSGLTGAPHMAAIETHWSRDDSYYAVPWRGTWAGEQGGAVLGHAIHNHDMLTQFMGPVRAVSAMTATRINDIETEDCGAVTFQFENGALATSSITLGAATDETRLRFVFENLTATSGTTPYAPGQSEWTFTARSPRTQPEIDAALKGVRPEHAGFAGFLTQVAGRLNGAPHQAVSLAEGADSIALVTAIYHAAKTGERVQLPLDETHESYAGWCPAPDL